VLKVTRPPTQIMVASGAFLLQWIMISGVAIQRCRIRHHLTTPGLRMIRGVITRRLQEYPLFLLEWIVISGVAIQAPRIPEYPTPTPVMIPWWTIIPEVWYPHPLELPLLGLREWILLSEAKLLKYDMDIIKQQNLFYILYLLFMLFSNYNIFVCHK